jgi:uncharacterized protein (DUF427 family)
MSASQPTMQAVWHGTVIAESAETVLVEGNHYFPRASLVQEHFRPTEKTTVCPWKGTATYFTVQVGGAANPDAAWTYEQPKAAAAPIAGHVAFWRGVEVRPV